MCQRLAELGMELAEATQRRALQELQPRPERRMPSIPGVPIMPSPIAYPDYTAGELFAVLSRCVRQAIHLEARIAGGAYQNLCPDHPTDRTPNPSPPPAAPPRNTRPNDRPNDRPDDRTRLRPEQLEDDLAGRSSRTAPEILAGICQQLGPVADAAQFRPTLPGPSRPVTAASPPRQAPKPTRPPAKRPPIDSG